MVRSCLLVVVVVVVAVGGVGVGGVAVDVGAICCSGVVRVISSKRHLFLHWKNNVFG